MKAWTLVRHGEPRSVLELREHDDPRPGKGQVLIRAEGFGLNYAEVMAVRGLYRDAPKPPCVLGYETVGRVVECGEDAPSHLLGERVVAITRFGGQAQLVVTDHRACAVLSDELPVGMASALATQGATAWYAARVLAPLREGQNVLVHSAAGGVGQLLVQLAVGSGCRVIGVVGGRDKIDAVRHMGATEVIDRSTQDHARTVREVLGHRQLDVSFNATGGTTFKKDLSLLASGGRLVIFGGSERGAGMFGALRFVWHMGLVIPVLLMMRSISLLGVNMLRIGEHRPELLAECLHKAVQAGQEGVLRPHVHHTYPAEQLPEAYLALASGATIGKVAVQW